MVRAAIAEHSLGSLLVTNPVDIRYLTGFRGDDSVAIVTPRRLLVVSDFRFQEELEQIKGRARVVIRSGDMIAELARVILDLKLDAIGFQAEYVTVQTRRGLARAVGARRLKETVHLLRDVRAIKDETEIRLIRRAVKIQQQALLATLETIEPGQSELEIASELEAQMREAGASGAAFESIVAVGANGSLPHATPGKTKLRRGRTLLIDWGARFGGYCSDMTRTLGIGSWPKKLREIYGVVAEAQLAAITEIRPGVEGRYVDAAARDVIAAAGYGPQFGHGLGHGLGLDVHEHPRLSRLSKDVLEEGMVVTVEPGVYIPGLGGVRIEDDVLVTGRGVSVLSTLPKDMEWATR